MKEKTYVEDVDRSVYDLRNEDRDAFRVEQGLTAEIVAQISREKKKRMEKFIFFLFSSLTNPQRERVTRNLSGHPLSLYQLQADIYSTSHPLK